MFKKLLLTGFLCIGLMALLVPQASAGCCCNPRFCASWLKGDVRCNLSVSDNIYGASAECRVYGTGPNGQLTGTAFCVATESETEAVALDMAKFAKNVEDCRLKGKGHIKRKGKGHQKHGDCETVPDEEIDIPNDFFSEDGIFGDCNDGECLASILIQTRPEDDPCPAGYTLVDFVPDAFYGYAAVYLNGNGEEEASLQMSVAVVPQPDLVITELCTATGGLYYNCQPVEVSQIPCFEGCE